MTDRFSAFQSSVKGYQRHRHVVDNLLVAAALALVVFSLWTSSARFGMEWAIVVALAVLAFGIQERAWGYYAAVAALLPPLWTLSPYLMALFVALALLPRQWMIAHLPAVLLALSAPVLAEWHVPALAPLLGGLAGGSAAGFGIGVGSALWLKIAAALAERPADLSAMHGATVTWSAIAAQAQGASSLEILRLPLAPFLESSTALLFHLLQVVGWGMAGWLTGKVRRYLAQTGAPRFALVPALSSGALVVWALLFVLPAWLGMQPFWRFLSANRISAGIALAAITAAFLTTILERSRRPVVQRAARPQYTRRRTREGMVLIPTNLDADLVRSTGRTRTLPPAPPVDEDEGVIMLEID